MTDYSSESYEEYPVAHQESSESETITHIHQQRTVDQLILDIDENTDDALIEIEDNIAAFLECCRNTIPQIRDAGFVGQEVFRTLIYSAKEHNNIRFKEIAIALEQNSVDSITNRFNRSMYNSGTIDDETYKFIVKLKRDINALIQ